MPKARKQPLSRPATEGLETEIRLTALEENISTILDLLKEKPKRPSRAPTPRAGRPQRTQSTPPRRRDDIDGDVARPRHLSPPDYPLREAAALEDLTEATAAMFQEIPPIVSSNGKKRKLFPRDFLPRRAARKAREASYELTFEEHLTGLARMVLSEPDRISTTAILTHIAEITEDSLTHPWSAVSDWSNTIIDLIAEEKITWQDLPIIQAERMKLCWTLPLPEEVVVILPCHKWNRAACGEKESPHASSIKSLLLEHVCAVCYATKEDRNTHQARNCYLSKPVNPSQKPNDRFKKKEFKPHYDKPRDTKND